VPGDAGARERPVPHSPALAEFFSRFVAEGWKEHDIRAERGLPVVAQKGVVTDYDIVDDDEMRRNAFYMELLRPTGFQWFAGLAFEVEDRFWCAGLHRAPAQGPFLRDELAALAWVPRHLAIAGKRAALFGHRRVESLESVLGQANRGVAALDASGRIIWTNERAEEILRLTGLARQGRLASRDAVVDSKLDHLVKAAVSFGRETNALMPRPALVSTDDRRDFLVDAIPMPRDFQTLLSGIAALVTLREVSPGRRVLLRPVRERFRLTQREAELATQLATGKRLAAAAVAMTISAATARQHLKSIFAKTGASSQVELVALLARFVE
jgi:DNA-binding CsgD family transcriptional regulator/PAS domain-containing protein